MKIESVATSKLIPYKNNPRLNDEAVNYVANSIKEFGFKVPIIIDKNNVIVAGHTRLKAAKQLGMDKVPCIRASDLDDEQIKAFRIADNSVSDVAKWDLEKLNIEIGELSIDMDQFGIFDIDIPSDSIDIDTDDEGWYGDERERTNRAYNLDDAKTLDWTEDFWQMPTIRNNNYIPNKLIGFNYAKTSTDKECGIHFFVDDYQFERVWNYPEKYTDILFEYDCILSPDFSLYMDMPMPMKIWNVYRSRFIGAYYQNLGIKVIPTVSWAEKETYEFCFRGIEQGSVVATSTIGVKEDKAALKIWQDGMNEMISQIKPSHILLYGGQLDFDYRGIKVTCFKNEVTERWKGKVKEI